MRRYTNNCCACGIILALLLLAFISFTVKACFEIFVNSWTDQACNAASKCWEALEACKSLVQRNNSSKSVRCKEPEPFRDPCAPCYTCPPCAPRLIQHENKDE